MFKRHFNAWFCKNNKPIWHHINEELSDFHTPTDKCETGTAIKVLYTGYWQHIFLYVLDELFHIFKKLKADDFDVQCIIMWEILHIAQCCCTEQCGCEKVKENTLRDAYLHVDFQEVINLERLAWAIYDGIFVPGRMPDLSGYQDGDCIVMGTLIPLIYQGEMNREHCGPTTIAACNTKKATELTKEQGLHATKTEEHVLPGPCLCGRLPP